MRGGINLPYLNIPRNCNKRIRKWARSNSVLVRVSAIYTKNVKLWNDRGIAVLGFGLNRTLRPFVNNSKIVFSNGSGDIDCGMQIAENAAKIGGILCMECDMIYLLVSNSVFQKHGRMRN